MRYFALATDYDGTLATDGQVDEITIQAMERFTASGRKVILVTGRTIESMQAVFPRLDCFERVVAENGAVVYNPASRHVRVLDEPPPSAFLDALRTRGIEPEVGHVIVATVQPHEGAVLDAIRELGLELHVVFNKGAVMVLPARTNKSTGLAAALSDLGLSAHNVVGVGDAENDHAFLAMCECAVSVENALPAIKERSDWVTTGAASKGVAELMDRVLKDDLASLAPRLSRRRLVLGETPDSQLVSFDAFGTTALLAGPSGSGKSTIAKALVERLMELEYQICVVDPEGDYEQFAPLAQVGSPENAPTIDEVDKLLADPKRSVSASLMAVPKDERPTWFGHLLSRVQDMRSHAGRPHFLIIDEAHHVMPKDRDPSAFPLSEGAGGRLMVTVRPESLSPAALRDVDVVVTTPQGASDTFAQFARAAGLTAPACPEATEGALVWRVRENRIFAVIVAPARTQHLRHKRKYAHGDLGEERSFHFRGPDGAMNLKAQNLVAFAQLAAGIDDGTWLYHLQKGEYSDWFREEIKDDSLAAEAGEVEQRGGSAAESRAAICAAIDRRYTLPA